MCVSGKGEKRKVYITLEWQRKIEMLYHRENGLITQQDRIEKNSGNNILTSVCASCLL